MAERRPCCRGPVALDRYGEMLPEVQHRSEHPRIQKGGERIEVGHIVLDRRGRRHDPEPSREPAGRPGTLRGRVLDGLRLVQDDRAPLDRRKRAHVVVEEPACRSDRVERSETLELPSARGRRTGVGPDVERQGEPTGLVEPVRDDRGRGHYEHRPTAGAVQEERKSLHGLALPHVVGQLGEPVLIGRAGAPPGAYPEPEVPPHPLLRISGA